MKALFVHTGRCLGCLSCHLACAVEHSRSQTLLAAVTETPAPRSRLFVTLGQGHKLPLTCRHCDPAPCVDACIAGALTRDERGAVVQEPDRCRSCWTCIMVCPYGVVTRQPERNIAVKCDLCPDRQGPACVDACPTQALVFCEAERFAQTRRGLAAGLVAQALDGEPA